jgi:phage terminase large subunit GpA-like protein
MNSSYASTFLEAIRPDKKYSVSEWSDNFRYLSNKSSAEPGKWRTDRVPYLKEIMDYLSVDNPTQEIVVMKGAQLGFTESGNNWIGYIIDHAPAPTLAVLPTVELAKRNSKQRLDPLIEDCPVLKKKIAVKRQGDSSNTLLEKDFPGGTIVLTGANSAVGLCSMPARFIFFDEIDRYPHDIGGEGSPIGLAQARSRTFAKRKWFKVSTPTNEGSSQIAEAYSLSDQRKCYLPCPKCDHFQVLVFGQLRWEKGDASTTRYHCIECDYPIQNWEKTKMLKRHKWIAEKPDCEVAGFHISSLYSPVGWWSWEDIVQDWIDAQGNQTKLKVFINTTLGETWKEEVEVPDYERLYERRKMYPRNIVPKDVVFLTAGVDIQKDRIEFEIVGWCKNKVSYSIDYRVYMGDTATSDMPVFDELRKILDETFPLERNKNLKMGIKMVAVDSGYNTQEVYDWCRKFASNRVAAIKGTETLNVVYGIPKGADVTIRGKTVKRGLRVWPLGVGVIKAQLYGWLKQSEVGNNSIVPYGFCFFPEYGLDYFKQLTAERLVTSYDRRGFKKTEWVKNRERNEALDCRVYARAAASILGIDRFNDDTWKNLENEVFQPTIKDTPKSRPKKKREKEGWL